MSDDPPDLRASHADRDRVVDALRVAAGDGRLSAEELDTRLESALSARTLGELAELTADLPIARAATGKDVLVIEQHGGRYVREGRWPVPESSCTRRSSSGGRDGSPRSWLARMSAPASRAGHPIRSGSRNRHADQPGAPDRTARSAPATRPTAPIGGRGNFAEPT
jgi:hypothetical protein